MERNLDWRAPYPGADEYEHQSEPLEKWARAKNTVGGFALASRFVRGAREALREWWASPDRLSFRASAGGGQATAVMRGRLEGSGVPSHLVDEIVAEQLKARFA